MKLSTKVITMQKQEALEIRPKTDFWRIVELTLLDRLTTEKSQLTEELWKDQLENRVVNIM